MTFATTCLQNGIKFVYRRRNKIGEPNVYVSGTVTELATVSSSTRIFLSPGKVHLIK